MNTNQQKTVMIVEDSGIDRDLLRVAIERKYNVITAENGFVAESILESGQEVSIILLDVIMPITNGFEFLEWIQEKPEFRHIPIVFTSLAATEENILKGLELGVRDVFVKPYDLGQVLRSIDNLVALAEYQKNSAQEDTIYQELPTVLIVDDSLLSRKILKETLRNQYQFLEATNGIEALEMLRLHKEKISLVLLDMIMPKMDGYEMMKIATAENLLENIPVVAVTASEGQESYVRMLEAGICEVVKKPFSPLLVQGKFKNLIDLYHYGHTMVNETISSPPPEEKNVGISAGIFHLKFQKQWECIFVNDFCSELVGGFREKFLSDLLEWKVYDEGRNEIIFVKDLLQELSEVTESRSYEGEIVYEDGKESRKLKILFNSFENEKNQRQIYGGITDILDSGERADTNYLFSQNYSSQEQRERILCRYIIRGRRVIINSTMAKQIGIPDEIENAPEWFINHGYITGENREKWYGIFEDIHAGKPTGSYEMFFCIRGKIGSRRCLIEFTGITDEEGKPSGALVYLEYVRGQNKQREKRLNSRLDSTMASMNHFYEIASVNLTKGTCHLVRNRVGNQYGHTQEIMLDQILQETYQSVAPEYQEAFKKTFSKEAQLATIAKGKDEFSLTFLRKSAENKWIWVETVATRQYNPYNDDILVCVVSRMVEEYKVQEQLLLNTLRTSLERQEGWEQYTALCSRIFHGEAYADYDDGRISTYGIGTFSKELGCSGKELALATSPKIPQEDRDSFLIKRREAIQRKEETFITYYRVKTIYGTWIWVSNTAIRFKDKKGEEGYIYFLVDSTYEQTLNEQLRVQKKEVDTLRQYVQTDQLSGTYSREYFLKKVQDKIDRDSENLYIIRLNISQFKTINELHGTESGDRLLKEIGQRLKVLAQERDFIVGRFSADRFYMCAPKEEFEDLDLEKKIEIPWLGIELNLTYGVYPVGELCSIQVMCDRADTALKAVGKEGAEYIHYYNDEFHQKLMREREVEREMENALSQRQFSIYIQPKFDVERERITGGEVLVRWIHPQKGLISPGVFIGVFEKNGFIRELDYYVWEESCRFLAECKKKGMPLYPLSVNVSRIHFYSNILEEKWLGLLEKYKLNARDIELEITESICDENPEMIINHCHRLRNLGFRVSMDDFGSGYSSLNMLRKLPLDIIKMDLKFLEEDGNQDEKTKGRDILRTQIELAHTIGLDVVVEGLETKEQDDFIKEIGSCAAQGYYYAKPMPAAEYAEMVQNSKEDSVGLIPSGMAAKLRRERLRQEQLQPLLEVIYAGNSMFGYLLPEKVGILPKEMAENFNSSQRVPNMAIRLANSGLFSLASASRCVELLEAVEKGQRSGSTVVEYMNPVSGIVPHWLRFDTVLDYEGNPLIAIFIVEELENITGQLEELMKSR